MSKTVFPDGEWQRRHYRGLGMWHFRPRGASNEFICGRSPEGYYLWIQSAHMCDPAPHGPVCGDCRYALDRAVNKAFAEVRG